MVREIMVKILMNSVFLLVLAGVTLGGRQKRIYVDPLKPHLGGIANRIEGQHHVQVTGLYSFCGGSLIHADWVITAAHCDDWFLRAVLNVHPDTNNERKFKVKKHICRLGKAHHDLMLLKLERDHEQWRRNLPTIALPARGCYLPVNEQVTIYGWMDAYTILELNGTREKLESIFAPSLRCAHANISHHISFKPPKFKIFKKHYKAGDFVCFNRENVSSNKGDSGGSLVWNGMLYGVLSGGSLYFGVNEHSYYMDMCKHNYRDWIDTITQLP